MCEDANACASGCGGLCAKELKEGQERYLGIVINHNADGRLTDQARDLLSKFYMRKGEKIQHGYARACTAWATFQGKTDYRLAQRLYNYVSQGWFGFASPVLSNAPVKGEKMKGLPISCFAGYVPDSVTGLIEHSTEFRWLSVMGGGVGGHWSDVRAVSDKAPGPIPFIRTLDADALAYKQGKTRKGSYAAYLDVNHPDIVEYIGLRTPTGDSNRKCLGTGFHHAVNITDDFMRAVLADVDWDLLDPHDQSVRGVVSAKELWESMLETRTRTGEPYLNFIDTANRYLNPAQKALGLKIRGSNLCNEIHEVTGIDHLGKLRTFVCCLSSINLEKMDEWLPFIQQFVGDLITMLDNVLQFFIDNAGPEIESARYSAMMERSLGLGTMGIHALLQQKGMAWETDAAVDFDAAVHKAIQDAAIEQSLFLGTTRGEAPDLVGTGRRNANLMALAPCANNASITGTSPGIDMWKANAFAHRTRAGTHYIKNQNLEHLLEMLGQNTDDVWQDIVLNNGSVQHLSILTEHERLVFRTAIETNQMWTVKHAAARQKNVCQGQSVNLFFPPKATRAYVNRVHLAAWELGLKGLYYYRTEARNRAESVSVKKARVALLDAVPVPAEADDCIACQG